MVFTKTQIGIAVGSAALLVFGFVGYLGWLRVEQSGAGARTIRRQGSADRIAGQHRDESMNPLRDRSTEKAANQFLRELRDGHGDELLAKWEQDYHKKYAHYICREEADHPLLCWELVEWEDAPPLVILHYRGQRPSNAGSRSGRD